MNRFLFWRWIFYAAGSIIFLGVGQCTSVNDAPYHSDETFSGDFSSGYSDIPSNAEEEFADETGGLGEAFDHINSWICEIDLKLEAVRNSFKSTILSFGDIMNSDKCDITYEGRCFHAISIDSPTVQFSEAKRMCENLGWQLGNIYDDEHYSTIVSYLRSKLREGQQRMIVWTGMLHESQNNLILSMSGVPLNTPTDKLQYARNVEANGPEHIAIHVVKDGIESEQGLHTYEPAQLLDGALCEL